MTRKNNKKLLSFILSMMLIVAMACNMTGCNDNAVENPQTNTEAAGASEIEDVGLQAETESKSDATILGEGVIVFMFTVIDAEGNETVYEIHTNETVVGDALLELGLIAGDENEYGLYVKTVNGITVDYETDGKYWAFYINGEYAMTGVDGTPIADGEEYAFKVE